MSLHSVLGVLSNGRLVLPLWVGSQALRFDANMIIFTGRGKAPPLTPLVIVANLLREIIFIPENLTSQNPNGKALTARGPTPHTTVT